jgi:hypothetical protein
MKPIAISAMLSLAATAAAWAAPLQPAQVPADAKWVVHVDFEALGETAFAEKLHADQPNMVQGVSAWLRQEYGIDPRQDLKGLTAFNNSYQAHTGALILQANYDADKVRAKVEHQPGVHAADWQDHTLYTWTIKDHNGQERELTTVLVDDSTVVFASSPEKAKETVKLLRDRGSSLAGKDSPLIAHVPEHASLYGAAIDLNEITRHEHAFPILKQHERIVYAFGERDGKVFEDITLVGQSPEVAREMKKILEGATAFVKLWASGGKHLTGLADATEISREGKTVTASWQADPESVLAALEELQQQAHQNQEQHEH